jgi:hypothetical protein
MTKPRDPYNRIVAAAKAGRGVRLTPDECWLLMHDDAVSTTAETYRREPDAWDARVKTMIGDAE